jgi:hypothetical protein
VVTLKVIKADMKDKTRKTPLAIYHPLFRKGYRDGRRLYFREKPILTDKHLVEFLWQIVEDTQQGNTNERKADMYYAIGFLVGQMSACVMPRQPHEDNTQELQEAFLLKVRQKYASAGESLVETIQQFWTLQDQLAQILDADSFTQMLIPSCIQR